MHTARSATAEGLRRCGQLIAAGTGAALDGRRPGPGPGPGRGGRTRRRVHDRADQGTGPHGCGGPQRYGGPAQAAGARRGGGEGVVLPGVSPPDLALTGAGGGRGGGGGGGGGAAGAGG